jgi:hypothetical protein
VRLSVRPFVIETTVLAGVIAVRPIGPETVSNQSLLGSNRVSEAGLLHDAWNVRLIPHYSLAVWALFIHLGCGLRGVLLSYRTPVSTANASAWGMVGLGAAIAATVILSMCRLHIR